MEPEPLIPKHGGYRKLKSFQIAQLCYDVTVRFCDRYIIRFIHSRCQNARIRRVCRVQQPAVADEGADLCRRGPVFGPHPVDRSHQCIEVCPHLVADPVFDDVPEPLHGVAFRAGGRQADDAHGWPAVPGRPRPAGTRLHLG